jgi:hypothetical protein
MYSYMHCERKTTLEDLPWSTIVCDVETINLRLSDVCTGQAARLQLGGLLWYQRQCNVSVKIPDQSLHWTGNDSARCNLWQSH